MSILIKKDALRSTKIIFVIGGPGSGKVSDLLKKFASYHAQWL
jgi:hypothetical protein